jgi:lysophospholipase L1-like esterase
MLIAFKGSANGRRERLCGSGLLLWKSAAMDDQRDGLPASLSQDGVHPTPAGYAVMAPLVEAGIDKALKIGNRE